MRFTQYERALVCGRTHEELLMKAVKGKKTRKGFANAIYRVWCKMAEADGQKPELEVACLKGHDCAENTYHVMWEAMPSYLCYDYGFSVSNEWFFGEHYWSFSVVVCE